MALEGLVDSADVRDLTAGPERQVVTHEAVEVRAVGLLPEGDLHRPPVLLVEALLPGGVQTHQDEVADQVGLTQLAADRVHALEDELGIILITTEGDIHDHEFCESLA